MDAAAGGGCGDVKPTQADCDELATMILDWAHKFGPVSKSIFLIDAIVGSIGHHEIERDGFELGDECYESDCAKVIGHHYAASVSA